jgi:hypothetical protein
MPFSVFVMELGFKLGLEVEWEKASEKESEKDLWMLDGSCSQGQNLRWKLFVCCFYVVPKKLYESR